MDGTRIVMVRHGESQAQVRKVVGGHTGCTGLSDLGRRQVGALAERLARSGELHVDAVYASLMPRAIETAEILAPAVGGSAVVRDCAFCEHHPGEGDGMRWEEFDRRYPAPEEWDADLRRDPGGETWAEMKARVAGGLDAIVERHAGGTVLVACHGGVVIHAMIRWLALDTGVRRAWMNPANSSITEWRFGASPFPGARLDLELVRYNDHAHLAGLA